MAIYDYNKILQASQVWQVSDKMQDHPQYGRDKVIRICLYLGALMNTVMNLRVP
jgi:hypothetical protein